VEGASFFAGALAAGVALGADAGLTGAGAEVSGIAGADLPGPMGPAGG
jgi:hypothetical protein